MGSLHEGDGAEMADPKKERKVIDPSDIPDDIVDEAMKKLEDAQIALGGHKGAARVDFETEVLCSVGWTLATKGGCSRCSARSLSEQLRTRLLA